MTSPIQEIADRYRSAIRRGGKLHRDGRRLLLWAKGGPQVGWWRGGRWLCTRIGAPLDQVTHYAEIDDSADSAR